AQPDPAHERLDVHAYRPGAVGQRFAQGHEQVAREAALDAGFRHGCLLDLVDPLFRVQPGDFATVAHDAHAAPVGSVVGALYLGRALEHEAIAAQLDHVAGRHAQV